jgi:hypothetical protein
LATVEELVQWFTLLVVVALGVVVVVAREEG